MQLYKEEIYNQFRLKGQVRLSDLAERGIGRAYFMCNLLLV